MKLTTPSGITIEQHDNWVSISTVNAEPGAARIITTAAGWDAICEAVDAMKLLEDRLDHNKQ